MAPTFAPECGATLPLPLASHKEAVVTLGIFNVPDPINEPIKSYAPGTPERTALKAALAEMAAAPVKIPLVIGGKPVKTGKLVEIRAPHNHALLLGRYHRGGRDEALAAIKAAKQARREWAAWSWEERAGVFLKAAELLAGPWRDALNASTMLGQSKTVFQAEIDSACELIDFFRFNAHYARRLMEEQPNSAPGIWNRMEHRPLEGFVFAVTPFNFTSIAGNLPTAPALMGNTVVWKPASTSVLSAHYIMQLLIAAGLPDGVINLVLGSGAEVGDVILSHPDLAGIHFTGSTAVFQSMWKTVGANIAGYRSYPRIVGETGGKDFVVAHRSADVDVLATALVRGAFEYQGQKCSAASRAYVPKSLWPKLRKRLEAEIATIKMGDIADFSVFMGAVIDKASFDKLSGAIVRAKKSKDADIVIGGGANAAKGWFVEPTVIRAKRPDYETMAEELFGPVLTLYVYPDEKFAETLALCDKTSPYGLTGSIIAQDRTAINEATEALRYAAGNFYVNDKPTGAVVGQQPFGGGRASGTNDKAGSLLNLLRWVSPRSIKETFVPPTDYRYPYMREK
ncbi:MAG: L-glutamate gamma-semialdehyde dehydrogenase [Myxococcales bacterium]|nr:MAG: L-glutamate gamma-semialdehyde dehydrogenase [Myxococcales bacterium]